MATEQASVAAQFRKDNMPYKFIAQLRKKPLRCDGAMGTMIYSRGIPFERCFDELNISLPAVVADIHRGYIGAGADVIQTNTFGANRIRLGEHGLENSVVEINRAGVELAQRVVEASFSLECVMLETRRLKKVLRLR